MGQGQGSGMMNSPGMQSLMQQMAENPTLMSQVKLPTVFYIILIQTTVGTRLYLLNFMMQKYLSAVAEHIRP